MSKTLVIGSEEFEFPEEGNNSGNYGESVTSWADAVTRALSTVQKPNDIPDTEATILNNTATFTSVLGLSFNTSEVISINTEYRIQRTTDTITSVESGFIEGFYDGTNWQITIRSTGNAGVEFDITGAGQIQYKSTLISGANYSGSISFRAKVFNVNA